ncbi:CDF family Co(II)/Ni(II) efflux transporter DmeF [Rhizobium sp. FY34]|uniref:CDF family Co(II)/Ni(II) efflux transporter DmeF n=1 Tax=Rhizobium sp. FY34 TaxID=2562309 RepID=UPI0010BFD775|nr:CDF family Co(II)/Ni(II) efflux transporter DmeF [Rhizobium sp. FY34]
MSAPIDSLSHDHVFLGKDHARNERKVWLVIAITATMMVVEIAAGSFYGSMALLADGWHMSTHAGAMLIAAGAYWYARRSARDPRFTFGTGKLGDLAGFASAMVLAMVALLIAAESAVRLAQPVEIAFNQAILVAILGLAVNLVSAYLLRDEPHHHGHGHGHGHAHDHDDHDHDDHDHDHDHHDHHDAHDHAEGHHHEGHHHPHPHPVHAPARRSQDHNLRAAYLHVLADALTSVLAIVALLFGRSYGWVWLDPLMGIVGGLVIARWSFGLLRDTGRVLLDVSPRGGAVAKDIRDRVESDADQITDLHVWQVGPGHHAAILSIAAREPQQPAAYKAKLRDVGGLSHVTVEVTRAA